MQGRGSYKDLMQGRGSYAQEWDYLMDLKWSCGGNGGSSEGEFRYLLVKFSLELLVLQLHDFGSWEVRFLLPCLY